MVRLSFRCLHSSQPLAAGHPENWPCIRSWTFVLIHSNTAHAKTLASATSGGHGSLRWWRVKIRRNFSAHLSVEAIGAIGRAVGVEAIVEAVILHSLLTLLVLAPVCARLISTSDDMLQDSLFCRRHHSSQRLSASHRNVYHLTFAEFYWSHRRRRALIVP